MSLVPQEIRADDEQITIVRAWPRSVSSTELRLRVEGRDDEGRLRAGTLDLRRDPTPGQPWAVHRARLAPFATDDALPGLQGLPGDLVVHRVGRRAVVRRSDDYVKVVRPDRVAPLLRAHDTGAHLVARAGWGAPHAEEVPDRPGAVSLPTMPGVPMHDLAAEADVRVVRRAWRTFSAGWPRIVRGEETPALPLHAAAAEAELTEQAVHRALTAWAPPADVRERILRRLADVRSALLTGAGPTRSPSHRDLHDKQILVGERLSLLDLDTAALAEPELDLANLLEHVLLRGRQGLWSGEAVTAGVDGVVAAASALGADGSRLAAYRAATRLRIASIYIFRPRWSAQAQEWLATDVDESSLIEVSRCGHPRLGAWTT